MWAIIDLCIICVCRKAQRVACGLVLFCSAGMRFLSFLSNFCFNIFFIYLFLFTCSFSFYSLFSLNPDEGNKIGPPRVVTSLVVLQYASHYFIYWYWFSIIWDCVYSLALFFVVANFFCFFCGLLTWASVVKTSVHVTMLDLIKKRSQDRKVTHRLSFSYDNLLFLCQRHTFCILLQVDRSERGAPEILLFGLFMGFK